MQSGFQDPLNFKKRFADLSECSPLLRLSANLQVDSSFSPSEQLLLRSTIPSQTSKAIFFGRNDLKTNPLKKANSSQLHSSNQLQKEDQKKPLKHNKNTLPDILKSPNQVMSPATNTRGILGNLLQTKLKTENSEQYYLQKGNNFRLSDNSLSFSQTNSLTGSFVQAQGSNNNTIPRENGVLKRAQSGRKQICCGATNNSMNSSINIKNEIKESFANEKDERFCYLMKYGIIKRVEHNGGAVFVELESLSNGLVCYRRPYFRESNIESARYENMNLLRIPLLEGEEKLKLLSYRSNKIQIIENLVSINGLLVLDLSSNNIVSIQNLSFLPCLKVLYLQNNSILKITGLDSLTNLEVLNLASNKISRIEGLQKLTELKSLNLASNFIPRFENIDSCSISLVDLNLTNNLLEALPLLPSLPKLTKLFLSDNRIPDVSRLSPLRALPNLSELSIDGNTFTRALKPTYMAALLQILPNSISVLDKQPLVQLRDDIQFHRNNLLAAFQQSQLLQSEGLIESSRQSSIVKKTSYEANANLDITAVLGIVSNQWKEELKRIEELDLKGQQLKEQLLNSKIQSGHAELDENSFVSLYVYGNAFEIVLKNKQFHDFIEHIQLQYIHFERLIERSIMQELKNFKRLKELTLLDNHLVSLLQLSRLEELTNLRALSVDSNELIKCSFLKEFVIYRFPGITRLNSKEIKDIDRSKAKGQFHTFDKILQLPEKNYSIAHIRLYPTTESNEYRLKKKDKVFVKTFTKAVSTEAKRFINENLSGHFLEALREEKEFDVVFEEYLKKIIEDEIQCYV